MLRILVAALALLAIAAPSASAADIFATDNTAVITDPDDPRLDDRLHGFAHRVNRITTTAAGARAAPSCSTASSSATSSLSSARAASTSTA
jgi:hypothetical protein